MSKESQINNENVWKVSIKTPMVFIPSLEEVFYALYPDNYPSIAAFEIQGNQDFKMVEVYINKEPDDEHLKQNIKSMAEIFNISVPDISIEKLEDIDWISQSQKILKPIEAGHFYLFGSHDKDSVPSNRIPILMEAGQAFGTGSHETTNGCLLAIDYLSNKINPQQILDLGCGSGILAIAMTKQWEAHIIASDIDPVAIKTTSDNLKANNVTEITSGAPHNGVYPITSNGFEDNNLSSSGPYDLIVANILAEPLILLAKDIVKNLKPEGTLVLSGLLKVQEVNVLKAYQNEGMICIETFPINEWQTLLLRKEKK